MLPRTLVAHAFQDTERRDHECMMLRNKWHKLRINCVAAKREQVGKAIRARLDRIHRLLLAVDMYHCQLAPRMSGDNQCIQCCPVDARSSAMPGIPSIFVDDLNEIGTFGYSVINPGLRTLGPS